MAGKLKQIREQLEVLYNRVGANRHKYLIVENALLTDISKLQQQAAILKEDKKIVTPDKKIVTPGG